MRSATAKKLAGGQKITKVVTWNSMSQFFDAEHAELVKSDMVLVAETNLYHEDGDIEEDGYRLSEVLDTDLVMEIWTASGRVWSCGMTKWNQIQGEA